VTEAGKVLPAPVFNKTQTIFKSFKNNGNIKYEHKLKKEVNEYE